MSARTKRRALTVRIARPRAGMTLVEVVVATFILTGVILVLGGFSAKFAQANAQAQMIITANEIAASRLDEARSQPSYDAITLLNGVKDSVKVDGIWYKRSMRVRRRGSDQLSATEDYQVVTVTVTHPLMRRVVTKTTAIATY